VIHTQLPSPCNSGSVGQELGEKNLSYGASTTGNIYGVYDMSGGAWEYIMGNFNNIGSNSGWTDAELAAIEDKYKDIYITSVGVKGDATDADGTNGWYGDGAQFINSGAPWFFRSANWTHGTTAGAFYHAVFSGVADSWASFRIVIAPLPN
jgi:hypothetical protein